LNSGQQALSSAQSEQLQSRRSDGQLWHITAGAVSGLALAVT